jgi:hypothetical protein
MSIPQTLKNFRARNWNTRRRLGVPLPNSSLSLSRLGSRLLRIGLLVRKHGSTEWEFLSVLGCAL